MRCAPATVARSVSAAIAATTRGSVDARKAGGVARRRDDGAPAADGDVHRRIDRSATEPAGNVARVEGVAGADRVDGLTAMDRVRAPSAVAVEHADRRLTPHHDLARTA